MRLGVRFTSPVAFVGAAPRLFLDGLGGAEAAAEYAAGNGTKELRFEWVVPGAGRAFGGGRPSTGDGPRGIRPRVFGVPLGMLQS